MNNFKKLSFILVLAGVSAPVFGMEQAQDKKTLKPVERLYLKCLNEINKDIVRFLKEGKRPGRTKTGKSTNRKLTETDMQELKQEKEHNDLWIDSYSRDTK